VRLRKRPWVKDEFLQDYRSVNEPDNHKGNWSSLFQNDHPIHVEFGTGRGQFITTLAKHNPHINYIAMEQKQEVLVQALRKAQVLDLKNIRFILDTVNRVHEIFGEDEVARIYLNFSDPWPKKRHAKRRLTHRGYLNMYREILADDGEIHFKTDNEQLFEFSLNELNANGFNLKNISLNLYRDQDNVKDHVQTEYEEKFMSRGMPIYRVEAQVNQARREVNN